MVTNIRTDYTPWKEQILHSQHEWRQDFTWKHKAYLKFMQKQLCNCSWWTRKQTEDKANSQKNSRVVSKNETLRKTTPTKKGVGIPRNKCANTKGVRVVPANAADVLHSVSHGFSHRSPGCDRKLNVFVFQDSSTTKMIHLSRTKAVFLANSVLAHLSLKKTKT